MKVYIVYNYDNYQNYADFLKRGLEQAFDNYGEHPYIEEWEVE